jgi:hypothetical protein
MHHLLSHLKLNLRPPAIAAAALLLALLALAAACGDDDGDGDGGSLDNSGRLELDDGTTFLFNVSECTVTPPNFRVAGVALDGAPEPLNVEIQRSQGQTAITVGVNPDPVTHEPEKNWVLVDLIGEQPAVITVDLEGFTLTAQGLWAEFMSTDLPKVQGVLEVACTPAGGPTAPASPSG